MNYLIRILIVISFFFLSRLSFSQVNMFEVPNNDTLGKGQVYVQAETIVTSPEVKTSGVVTWGFGKDFEGGFNVHQLNFKRSTRSVQDQQDENNPGNNPSILVNLKKGFQFRDWYSLALGTRQGVNLGESQANPGYSSFWFLNSRISVPETHNKIVFAPYYGNRNYLGNGNGFGVMAGIELVMIKDQLIFAGDFISGNNSISAFNLGFELNLTENWEIDLGAQLPTPNSKNRYGLIFQITYQ